MNPGMVVETEEVHAAGLAESDFRKQLEAQTPLGRIGQPQDIAPAAVFLASRHAAWITRRNRCALPLTLSLSPSGGEGIEMASLSLGEGEGRGEGPHVFTHNPR